MDDIEFLIWQRTGLRPYDKGYQDCRDAIELALQDAQNAKRAP